MVQSLMLFQRYGKGYMWVPAPSEQAHTKEYVFDDESKNVHYHALTNFYVVRTSAFEKLKNDFTKETRFIRGFTASFENDELSYTLEHKGDTDYYKYIFSHLCDLIAKNTITFEQMKDIVGKMAGIPCDTKKILYNDN